MVCPHTIWTHTCPQPPSQSVTELEPEVRSPATMAQSQALEEVGVIILPTLSGSKLRQRAVRWHARDPPAGWCHNWGLSLGPSSSHGPLWKREGGRENQRGRWKGRVGQGEQWGRELKGVGEERASPWTGSPSTSFFPKSVRPLRAGHGCESITSRLHLVLLLHDLDLALSLQEQASW